MHVVVLYGIFLRKPTVCDEEKIMLQNQTEL